MKYSQAGRELLCPASNQFIKDWFRHEDNKTGCRFLVVDAYNNPRTLHFYERNDFRFLHTDEVEERA